MYAVLKYLLDHIHIKSLRVIGLSEHIVQRDPAVRVSVRRDADPQTAEFSEMNQWLWMRRKGFWVLKTWWSFCSSYHLSAETA